jgi:hypothetical protein
MCPVIASLLCCIVALVVVPCVFCLTEQKKEEEI